MFLMFFCRRWNEVDGYENKVGALSETKRPRKPPPVVGRKTNLHEARQVVRLTTSLSTAGFSGVWPTVLVSL